MQLPEVSAGRSFIFPTHFPCPDLSDSGLDDPVLEIGVFHGNHFGEAAVKVFLDGPQLYSWKNISADIRRLHVRHHPVPAPGFFSVERNEIS